MTAIVHKGSFRSRADRGIEHRRSSVRFRAPIQPVIATQALDRSVGVEKGLLARKFRIEAIDAIEGVDARASVELMPSTKLWTKFGSKRRPRIYFQALKQLKRLELNMERGASLASIT